MGAGDLSRDSRATLAAEFSELADRFRRAAAASGCSDAQGAALVESAAIAGGQLLKRLADAGVTDDKTDWQSLGVYDTPRIWAAVWAGRCLTWADAVRDRVPPEAGADLRTTFPAGGDPAQRIRTGELMPVNNWRRTAEEYAAVCRWLVGELGGAALADAAATGQGEPEPDWPTGFLGGATLADAMGVHATQRGAFFQRLMRRRTSLGDECWHEVRDPRPNNPRFLYRVDSPNLRALAAEYRSAKPA